MQLILLKHWGDGGKTVAKCQGYREAGELSTKGQMKVFWEALGIFLNTVL